MNVQKVSILKNRYVDSVTLMDVADRLSRMPGIGGAECDMGTPANIDLLTSLGYTVPAGVTRNDLIIAVSAPEEEQEKCFRAAMDILDHKGNPSEKVYTDLDEIDLEADPYDLVQISLPGEYAAEEIKKALRKGLDCFVFSDNVSLQEELECKELGRELGCLVMGPDAGVGLIDGVALAAGSIVWGGPVGIIGASGSGAQEVACLIERMGYGVSCIIGTGGRDLSPAIGGITMLMALERLAKDPQTQVICLVSKLADPAVMAKVLDAAGNVGKPVTAVFLGAPETLFEGRNVVGAQSLEEAAIQSVRLVQEIEAGNGKSQTSTQEVSQVQFAAPVLGRTQEELDGIARAAVSGLEPQRRYFRGLYCGGTFTEEALILMRRYNPDVPLYSNLDTVYAEKLEDPFVSRGHAILDLGAEEFTAKAPHPVFDPELRLRRLKQELEDPQAGVILLDFITGPGVHRDPVMPFVSVIREHPQIRFIATICGAAGDPQDIAGARRALEEAGCIVADSNAQSAYLASVMMELLERRQ